MKRRERKFNSSLGKSGKLWRKCAAIIFDEGEVFVLFFRDVWESKEEDKRPHHSTNYPACCRCCPVFPVKPEGHKKRWSRKCKWIIYVDTGDKLDEKVIEKTTNQRSFSHLTAWYDLETLKSNPRELKIWQQEQIPNAVPKGQWVLETL